MQKTALKLNKINGKILQEYEFYKSLKGIETSVLIFLLVLIYPLVRILQIPERDRNQHEQYFQPFVLVFAYEFYKSLKGIETRRFLLFKRNNYIHVRILQIPERDRNFE